MSMFCYQCQETARGTGCDVRGVCGKSEEVAKLQDLLIYTLKGLSQIVTKGELDAASLPKENSLLLDALFMTITNANYDEKAIAQKILEVAEARDALLSGLSLTNLHDAAIFSPGTKEEMVEKAEKIGVLATEDEDMRSLREIVTYGIKGMAAYTQHALNLGKENPEIYSFIYHALADTMDPSLSTKDLLRLTLETGRFGVSAMALLDEANTSRYGHPEITKVNIGARENPAILISGHDLLDLEQLLEQTNRTGIDVYTHCEMLPAHSYPFFKKYPHLVGNYGNAWWKQTEEFAQFGGPILFTTNCIVPPRSEEIRRRIFTTGSAGFPGCRHIEAGKDGKKDFSEIIELARTLPPPLPIEGGELTCGFAHEQVFSMAEEIAEAIRKGTIKKFVVMAGCDGRMKSREYYTEFAKALPADTIVLTAGCAKYRYNKIGLGMIGDFPRVFDAGQCNDSYSLVLIALKLKEMFGLDDINRLPIVYNIAWYEQKAVLVLLALLYLGVKNIHLGPSLPGFLSPAVARILTDTFGIRGIGTVEDDMEIFFGK